MEGFTVRNSQRFLEGGRLDYSSGSSIDSKSMKINNEITSGTSSSGSAGESFAATLQSAINQTNDLQVKANKAAEELAAGRTSNVQEVMIAAEKADISLRLMMQVRNKIIDAYQEIMKMQV